MLRYLEGHHTRSLFDKYLSHHHKRYLDTRYVHMHTAQENQTNTCAGRKVAFHATPSIQSPWSYIDTALPSGSKINKASTQNLWAPDFSKIGSAKSLYYSVSSFRPRQPHRRRNIRVPAMPMVISNSL